MVDNFKMIGSLDQVQKDLILIEKFERLDGKQIKALFDATQKEMRGINTTLAFENENLKKLLKESFDVNRELIKEVKKIKKENFRMERKLDEYN